MSSLVEHQELPWTALHQPVALTAGAQNVVDIQAEVVPIIIVPGIMGTRLQNVYGERVWDPDAKLHTLLHHVRNAFRAEQRRRVFGLDGDLADLRLVPLGRESMRDAPDAANAVDVDASCQELVAGAYGPAVEQLRTLLARRSALSQLCFTTPLFAAGYDWVGPPLKAAQSLAQRVRQIIASLAQRRTCHRAIIVTHSYGGLVTRAACRLFGLEKDVMGIVHAAQPALGAVAAYVHMKAGAPAAPDKISSLIEQMCLGPDAEHSAGLLAYMPGALSLLPFEGRGDAPWLVLNHREALDMRPRIGMTPYEDIYRHHQFVYGLLDARDKAFVKNRSALERGLALAEAFHQQLGDYVHPTSLHIAGTRRATFDKVELDLEGFADEPLESLDDLRLQELVAQGRLGTFSAERPVSPLYGPEKCTLRLRPPTGDGDGTVPLASALALARKHKQPSMLVADVAHATLLGHPRVVHAVAGFVEELLAARWHQAGAHV